MTLINSKKCNLFLSIFVRISVFKHFRGDWAYPAQFCWSRCIRIFFCQKFPLVLLGRILDDFPIFRLFLVDNCILIWLLWVIFDIKVIACAGWAYAEHISSLAEHTQKRFYRWWAYAEMFKIWISRPNWIKFTKIWWYRP